ncbi:MAG: hypothetical protein KDH20_09525 [Rhodocyclaceae bacterium]|nr:hypothetical protein [Rhodocyclaceae bacterium]
MPYTVSLEIAEANRRFFIMQSMGQFDHRAMVLRSVCELEFQCAQLLFALFKTKNPAKTWEEADSELFGENGLLSSLTRMVKIAVYLGLLEPDEVADLRIFARLRNMYAHGREREQFHEDPKAAALIRSLRLFKLSPTLQSHDDQGIFLSCYSFLNDRLRLRAEAL